MKIVSGNTELEKSGWGECRVGLIEANACERICLKFWEVREIGIQLYLSKFLLPEEPGSPAIISSPPDIQATSLTVKWTAPADDGGSPITAYRVVILKSGTEIKNETITESGKTSLSVGGLKRDTEYTVRVFARNFVFEGSAGEKKVKTKYEGKANYPFTRSFVHLFVLHDIEVLLS